MNIILLFILLIIIAILLIINIKLCGTIYKQLQKGGTCGHSKKLKQLHNVKPITYTISGEGNGLDYSQLRLLLANTTKLRFHFVEKPITERVDLSFGAFDKFYIKGKLKTLPYDPRFYKQHATIKNVLTNYSDFVDKSKLYYTVKKLLPSGLKYLPKSYNAAEFESLLELKFPIIVKKDNSGRSEGVIVATSKEEYYKAKNKLRKIEINLAKIKNKKPNYAIIISEYITNPLLLDGKKFHLRIYFLADISEYGIIKCIVYDECRIYTAKNKYKNGDWKNTDIHISGRHNTSHRYTYPDDIIKQYPNDFKIIKDNLNECNKFICSLITSVNVKKYPECSIGYYIFGADIMITNNFNVYILEINDKLGFRKYGINWEAYNKKFSYNLFSFILDNTVFPFFRIK